MLSPLWFDPEDCHGAGALALIRAVDAFDPSRGVPFEAFAYPRIYGAMVDHVRAQDWVPRGVRDAARKLKAAYCELAGEIGRPPEDKEVAAHLSLSIREFESLVRRAAHSLLLPFDTASEIASYHSPRDVIPKGGASPSARLEHQELVDLVMEAMARLSKSERTVVVLHYRKGLMFKEVAGVLGRSRARISQLHTKALLKLKNLVCRALEPKTSAGTGGGDGHG